MIVGVDVSSRRIDLAWLQDGKPCRWHQELGGPKTHLIDRLRSIRVEWPGHTYYDKNGHRTVDETTEIAIEYPFGRGNAIAALMSTVGIVTRQAPPWARVAWPSSQELRAAIGARNTKQSAHERIWAMYPRADVAYGLVGAPFTATISTTAPHPLTAWDEHSLDALVAAIGWARILDAQDAA